MPPLTHAESGDTPPVERLRAIEQRLETVEAAIENLNARFSMLQVRIQRIDKALDGKKHHDLIKTAAVKAAHNEFDTQAAAMYGQIRKLDNRVDELDDRTSTIVEASENLNSLIDQAKAKLSMDHVDTELVDPDTTVHAKPPGIKPNDPFTPITGGPFSVKDVTFENTIDRDYKLFGRIRNDSHKFCEQVLVTVNILDADGALIHTDEFSVDNLGVDQAKTFTCPMFDVPANFSRYQFELQDVYFK